MNPATFPHPIWHFALIIFMSFVVGRIGGGLSVLLYQWRLNHDPEASHYGWHYWLMMLVVILVCWFGVGQWFSALLVSRGI